MPWDKLGDVPPSIRSLASASGGKEKIPLTLDQCNEIGRMVDGMKGVDGIDSPMALAITNFRRMYKIEDGKWVKRKEKMGEYDEIDATSEEMNSAEMGQFAETYELKDFPFFKSGTHNGKTYTESDLDRIVSNFYSLKNFVQPILKLGHGGQKFLKNEGLPAIGWVESIKKMNQVLYAHVKDIPKRIYELIKNKAYKRPSAEIYLDFQDDEGAKYGLTLSAIALLGADIPAIKSLPDIEGLFNNELFNAIITCYNENYDRNEGGIIMPDEKTATSEEMERLKADIAAKEAQIAKLEEVAAKSKEAAEKIQEAQRTEAIKASIAKYKEGGKVLPVQEGALSALLLSFTDQKVLTYGENGTQVEGSQTEMLFKVLDALPNIVQFEELTQKRGKEKTASNEKHYKEIFLGEKENYNLEGVEVSELADQIAAQQKISYSEALVIASEQLDAE